MKIPSFFSKFLLLSAIFLVSQALSAQTPGTKVTTSKPSKTATGIETPNGQETSRINAATKTQVDSLRQLGKDNAEIAALLKSKTSTKTLVLGLKKTPARPPRPSGSGASTAPPALTEEEEADAVEMAQILASDGRLRGVLRAEQLSALWEVYEIPDLAAMLRILDRAGIMEDHYIVHYAGIIGEWMKSARSPAGGQAAVPFPAPNWLNQYPAFFDLYAARNLPAGRVYLEFTGTTANRVTGQTTPPNAFFAGIPDRGPVILTELQSKYYCTEQMVLRSVAQQVQVLTNRSSAQFIQDRHNRSPKTLEFWAAMLKLDNVPNGEGGTYPAFSAGDATRILIDAGFSTAQVVPAIRAVYQ